MLKKEKYKLSSNIKDLFFKYIQAERKKKSFANARTVRNFVEKVKIEQASRIAEELTADINYIKKIDLENAMKYSETKEHQKIIGFKKEELK